MTTIAKPMPQLTAAEETAYKRRWIALLLLSLSLMLIVIDSTIVNIAFPSIRKTFGASFADAEWVNSIYSLVFGAALITWGKLGDQFGRRNIFVLGAIVFTLGSLGTGLAPNIGVMILFRAMQGMGAAMMSPSTLSIVSSTFQGRERGMAFGIWGAMAGVSVALGPVLGGWLISYGTGITPDSWRLAFLVNVPIGVIAIIGAFWAIRETRDESVKVKIDWLGILLASLALGAIVFAAIEGQNYGWLQATKPFSLGPITYPMLASGVTAVPAGTASFIPFVFVFGLLMFVLFVVIEVSQERRGGEPLFEFGMLKYPSFRYGLITILIVALGEFGVVLVLSIFFQLAKGLDAFSTGLRFLPFAIAVLIAAPVAGSLSTRFGAKWVVTAGMVCEAVSLFWISQIMYENVRFLTLLPPFLLYGVGVGLAVAQLANIVLSDIPQNKAGVASGATNTLRQLGGSLGIAIIGAVLFGAFATEAKPLIENSTAFEDFGKRVAANTQISHEAQVFAAGIASNAAAAKKGIETALDNNEGGGDGFDVVDLALTNTPPAARVALRTFQGVDLDKPEVVTQIKQDLAPDAAILNQNIQDALGEGFSTAGRDASTVAAIFVALGALSSLMLPNSKAAPGAAPVMAH
ncbi:MAG: MFS transporter [Chloroflexota bacterium]